MWLTNNNPQSKDNSFRKFGGKEVSENDIYKNSGIQQTALSGGWVLTLRISFLKIIQS